MSRKWHSDPSGRSMLHQIIRAWPFLPNDLQRVTADVGVFTVHTGPAVKVLPDGRNAHLIQQPPAWWLPKFLERFELANFNRVAMGFVVVVERKRG